MHGLVIAAIGVLLVGACDPGVPPRNQADTLADTSTHPIAAGTPSLAAPSSTGFPTHSGGTTAAPLTPPDVSPVVTSERRLEHTPPPVLPGAANSEPASSPVFDPKRACKKDADCALVPDDCSHCPPCEATWRRAANRATVNRIVKARQAVECPPIYCEQCWTPPPPGIAPEPHGYLGDVAECRAGQCIVKGQ
jgi:hypothetical protein